MFETLSFSTIASYCLFSTFVFYQQLHAKNFRGASQGFHSLLTIFAFAGMITGVSFLVYLGWKVAWWAPLLLLGIGLLFQLVATFVERVIGSLGISLAGFLGWPLCAYWMFQSIP